jgi:hypothetical protein
MAGRITQNTTTDKGPNDQGPAKAEHVRPNAEDRVIHDPFHHLGLTTAAKHTTSLHHDLLRR